MGADLRYVNLSGAYLRGANLRGITVKGARFGAGLGLLEEEKQDLAKRGAIFTDTSGDRSTSYSPVHC